VDDLGRQLAEEDFGIGEAHRARAAAAGSDTQLTDLVATMAARPSLPTKVDRNPRSLRPKSFSVRFTAARDDSWVQISIGGAAGRVLFEGIIRQGKSIRVSRDHHLWASFGSLAIFDVSFNGRAIHPALNGTLDTVVTPSGIRAASTQAPSG
jgi:RodZ C-terminal domain